MSEQLSLFGFDEVVEEVVEVVEVEPVVEEVASVEESTVELVKSRTAKMSKRGIYIQDKALLETSFQVGTYFEVSIDTNIVTVTSTETKGKNTVSKRAMKSFVKPVIDIRQKDALATFEGCSELTINIFTDRIEIVGVK
jgi:DNA (cytosine-5)-methyltransferase 1